MEINVLTLFPEMFKEVLGNSILGRAQEKNIITINYFNLRDFAEDKHKTVDDTPCGGGVGMVLKIDVMDNAISTITKDKRNDFHIILLTPQGKPFNQEIANKLSTKKKLLLICGHYEGFDERIRENLVDEELSLGDFVMTGGEIAAMAIIDATARLMPGVLGKDHSSEEESFTLSDKKGKLLEYPVYTRPIDYKGWKVPSILLSGDHNKITAWKFDQARKRTDQKRPDLNV